MEYRVKRVLVEGLPRGADLWEWVRDYVVKNEIRAGHISAIGALERATIGSWNMKDGGYRKIERTGEMEIVSCSGNVSIKDGAPFPHLHVILGWSDGTTIAGHLMPGSAVFACELVIQELDGPPLERVLDPATGLPLWRR